MHKSLYSLILDNAEAPENHEAHPDIGLIKGIIEILGITVNNEPYVRAKHYSSRSLAYGNKDLLREWTGFEKEIEADLDQSEPLLALWVIPHVKKGIKNPSVKALLQRILKLASSGRNGRYTFLLVFPSLPHVNLVDSLSGLRALIEERVIVIVDNDGRELFQKGYPYEQAFVNHFRETNYRSIERAVRAKLIRRTNHFSHFDDPLSIDSIRCQEYFYDGSTCIPDISRYLRFRIIDENINNVLFHCPESPWLTDAVVDALSDPRLAKVGLLNLSHEQATLKKGKNLLLLDMVDTGNTHRRLITEIGHKKGSQLISETILISEQGKKHDLEDNLNYLIEVPQVSYNRGTNECHYCKEHVPYASKKLDSEATTPIRSVEFWQQARKQPFVVEKHYDHLERPTFASLPNFQRMIENNAGLYAYKAKSLLIPHDMQNDLDSEYVFISPEGDGAKALSYSLQRTYDTIGLQIDRPSITQMKRLLVAEATQDQLRSAFKDKQWFREMTSLRIKKYVIVDEFCVTGNTLSTLMRFLESQGKQVICFLVLVNFLDTETLQNQKIQSLYSINLTLAKPRLAPTPKPARAAAGLS